MSAEWGVFAAVLWMVLAALAFLDKGREAAAFLQRLAIWSVLVAIAAELMQ